MAWFSEANLQSNSTIVSQKIKNKDLFQVLFPVRSHFILLPYLSLMTLLMSSAMLSYAKKIGYAATVEFDSLNLPVRRNLVTTPSTKGEGLNRTLPCDLQNGRLYKHQLWHAIRTIYERLKTGRVDDLSLVKFPWQLVYVRVFSTKFCNKTTEIDNFPNLSLSLSHIFRTIAFFELFTEFLFFNLD